MDSYKTRYDTLFETSPMPILIVRGETILECNNAAVVMFGVRVPEDIAGQPVRRFVTPAFFDIIETRAGAAIGLRNMVVVIGPCVRSDGTEFEAEVTVSTIPHDNGTALLLQLMDLSGVAEVALQLRRERNLLNAMFQAVPVGCMLVNRTGYIDLANQRFTEISGYTKSDFFAAEEWFETVYPDPEYRNRVMADWEEDVDKPSADREYDIVRKDGATRTIAFHGEFLPDGRYLINMHDVTDDRHKTEELARARLEAEAANRAKSEFLAVMSHEIRTPLQSISGLADILKDTRSERDKERYLALLRGAAEHLTKLIDNVLDISSIEVGGLEIDHRRFSLDPMLERLTAQCRSRLAGSGVEFSISADERIPALLLGDPTRLEQVLINLLGNAIKFTDSGSVALTVMRQDDRLAFSVTDTGIGIPEDKQAVVFESFRQADSGSQRAYGGVGLGLAICDRLVAHMGGRLRVDSEPGRGSTFSFSIPLPEAPEEPAPALQPPCPPTVRPACILMADDDETNRMLFELFIEGQPLDATYVRNGLEAVRACEVQPFDLVILDVEMPEMDGYEAARRIRTHETATERNPAPMLALTAHAFAEARSKCQAAGFDAVLTKPYRKAQLLEAMAGLLAHGS